MGGGGAVGPIGPALAICSHQLSVSPGPSPANPLLHYVTSFWGGAHSEGWLPLEGQTALCLSPGFLNVLAQLKINESLDFQASTDIMFVCWRTIKLVPLYMASVPIVTMDFQHL